MAVETATKIQDLNPLYPADSDPTYQGAEHIRMVKTCLQNPESSFVPPGVVHTYAGATCPPGYLFCHGQSLSRTTYAALFAAIGTAYGSVDANSFNAPELRGYFIRGVNTSGAGIDYGRSLGNVQTDALISHSHDASHSHTASQAAHTHTFTYDYNVATTPNFLGAGSAYGQDTQTTTTGSATPAVTVNAASVTTSGPSTGVSTETRPYNVAMNYIIKY
jgi:microcystin-dependent protein